MAKAPPNLDDFLALSEAERESLLSSLTDEEADEFYSFLHQIVGGESLRDFIKRISPHHPPPRHLDLLIDAIEEARVRRVFVAISLPPGHAKTTLFMHAIAWWLSHYPADGCAYFSYNGQQANSKSVIARDLTLKAGVKLSVTMNNKSEWRTTAGGGLISGGWGGGTGQRVKGLMIIDDPFKNQVDSSSQAYRDELDEWFKTVAMTRLEGASVFIIHTRWHEDDLIGRVAKRRGWRVINLPAIAEANDPLGRATGEALWPELHPLSALEDMRETLGEFDFAALFQGSPRPRGGALFKDPHYYDPAVTSFEGTTIVIAIDPAASEKTSADYSVIVVLSVRPAQEAPNSSLDKPVMTKAVAYVRYVFRKQVEIPTLVREIESVRNGWGNAPIKVESVGAFKAVPQLLRDAGLERIHEIIPIGDKWQRAQPVAAAWNAGRVLVPIAVPGLGLTTEVAAEYLAPGWSQERSWLPKFLDELAKFTGVGDVHDDQVDALSHAWNNQSVGQESILDVFGANSAAVALMRS